MNAESYLRGRQEQVYHYTSLQAYPIMHDAKDAMAAHAHTRQLYTYASGEQCQ
jgi:hypothetical protein